MDRLTPNEIRFLLDNARSNRESSAALAQIPGQRWKEAHKAEVEKMDKLIEKLEAMKAQAERPQLQKNYRIFVDGKKHRATSSCLSFQNHVQEMIEDIGQGKYNPADVWLVASKEINMPDVLEDQAGTLASLEY